ncbi:hypothetical protein [Acanthamoeba castellanii mimivirus]|uniref:Uncharacterized protein n=4 Tax=Mimivirus TaxID=315393 RepID=E3VYY0_MIMIV|nr:hypothetical protein MIMI_gp0192 [Acanthamoeba polyphaga mimivirus]AMK61788.1 hypothetical protein [Samba virus]QTF49078.1 hypothetical protein [Mimivirus reunion]WMV61521.1 hypothetical protein qu_183 [Mimivirus sp.]BAV61261.1 hypothetical protein [Acanthamoeba castellanii mimivirus]ADO18027.1 hypothetical protein [Acanthamoeba polyphaga mimivirus]
MDLYSVVKRSISSWNLTDHEFDVLGVFSDQYSAHSFLKKHTDIRVSMYNYTLIKQTNNYAILEQHNELNDVCLIKLFVEKIDSKKIFIS